MRSLRDAMTLINARSAVKPVGRRDSVDVRIRGEAEAIEKPAAD